MNKLEKFLEITLAALILLGIAGYLVNAILGIIQL